MLSARMCMLHLKEKKDGFAVNGNDSETLLSLMVDYFMINFQQRVFYGEAMFRFFRPSFYRYEIIK